MTSPSDTAKAVQVAMDIVLRIEVESRGLDGIKNLTTLVKEEEAKIKLEQEKLAVIQVIKRANNNQNNKKIDSGSNIERWRNSPYYDPRYDDGNHVLENLCDANGLFTGEPGYDDNYKF